MPYRFFLTGSGIAPEALQFLDDENCVYETGDPKDTPDDLIRKISAFKPDALIVRQGKITPAVQDAAKNLKVISKHGVGTDNIDKVAATERGIPVMYTPLANFESVAEHALALILAVARKIPTEDRRIRGGVFDKKKYGGIELNGKTLGLIGYGNIARRLAELVAPFKMKVLVYHPSQKDEPLAEHIQKVKSPLDVLTNADVISFHCPLTPETRNLINADNIAQMKTGAIVINTARGGIINENDLHDALQSGKLGGAALDTFETEPPNMDHPLFKLENIIFTTHISGMSDNSFINMGMGACKNALAVLRNEEIDQRCLVNKGVLG